MSESHTTEHNRSLLVPVAVGLLAFLIWAVFQTIQLMHDRGNLKQAYDKQETPLQSAYKMRSQMDKISAGTLKLAGQGNDSAKLMVQALAERGITIDPDAKTPALPRIGGDTP